MMNHKPRVVTLGEIMLRLGVPEYLRLTQAHSFDVSFAGAEANVSVSLANFGIPTTYITRLPDNPIADKCIMELASYNVDTNSIIRGGNRIGVLYLETGSNMRPSRVFYDRENSSFATIPTNTINWKVILKEASWLHWTGITPALSQNAAEICEEAISAAKELGLTISCDLNYRKSLWQYGRTAEEIMTPLVSNCDIIIGNEEDCDKIFHIKPENFDVENTKGEINKESFISVCNQMMKKFPYCKTIAMTLRGAINANQNTWSSILYKVNKLYTSTTYTLTDIVDRVGSGDSFSAGLIYGILHYKNVQEALEFATAASCLKHTIKGDYNQVTKEEVERLVKGDKSGRVKR